MLQWDKFHRGCWDLKYLNISQKLRPDFYTHTHTHTSCPLVGHRLYWGCRCLMIKLDNLLISLRDRTKIRITATINMMVTTDIFSIKLRQWRSSHTISKLLPQKSKVKRNRQKWKRKSVRQRRVCSFVTLGIWATLFWICGSTSISCFHLLNMKFWG